MWNFVLEFNIYLGSLIDHFSITAVLRDVLHVELYVIAVTAIASLIIGRLLKRYGEYRNSVKQGLKRVMVEAVTQRTLEPIIKYPQGLLRLEYVVMIFEEMELDARINSYFYWSEVKYYIAVNYMLPLARLNSQSGSWYQRSLAARAFAAYPLKSDIQIIEQLINDDVPLVKLGASLAAVKLGHFSPIKQMVIMMESESRYLRNICHSFVVKNDLAVQQTIRTMLQQESDPFVRKISLDIICSKLRDKDFWIIQDDLQSAHKDLKMAAIRALNGMSVELVQPILEFNLSSSDWEIRSLAAKMIGDYTITEAIPMLLSSLKDRQWWVRINSAYALTKMGDIGIRVLQGIREQDDVYAYEMAQSILAIHLIEQDIVNSSESDDLFDVKAS
jgi:HEAT repeat protein